MTYQPKTYRAEGGDKHVIASGGVLDVESGGALKIAGTQITPTAAQFNFLAGVTTGTSAASKAIVLDANSKIDTIDMTAFKKNGTAVDATAAQLNFLASVTAGTIAASKALVLDADKKLSHTSASTAGGTSVEPFAVESVLTGIGGVGGRARFQLDTNVALGGWANALKAYTKFGASGRVTGLASALVAEMDLSAGTTEGTYAPLELELNLGSGAQTGTATSLIYGSVNGAAASTFDTNGFLMHLAGLTAGSGKVFEASTKTGIAKTHTLRINIGGTPYYIALHTSSTFGGS